jgi:hypothetical protein
VQPDEPRETGTGAQPLLRRAEPHRSE